MPFVKDNKLRFKHGYSRSKNVVNKKLYQIWTGIKQRCYNPKNKNYRWYGAVGITVCEEWLLSFESFAKWAESNGYKIGLQIDRKKGHLEYSPGNCRWVTPLVNSNNRKDNHLITYKRKTHTLSEWARILNMDPKVLSWRIVSDNWSIKKAFTQPVRKSPCLIQVGN